MVKFAKNTLAFLWLWALFQLWWLVVVGPGRGWPSPLPRVLVVVWFPPVGPSLVWSFQFKLVWFVSGFLLARALGSNKLPPPPPFVEENGIIS